MLELLEEYLGKGYKVYMENYYTSVPLLKELLEKGTWACGTTQKNRKHFSEQLRDTKLKPGEFQLATDGQLTAAHWFDRSDVFVLSTIHNDSVQTVMKRPKGSREKQPIPCPSCIVDCNKHMVGGG